MELTAAAFKRTEWKLRLSQASASGSTMREVLGLFSKLADGAVFLLDRDFRISFFSGSSHTSGALAESLLEHGGTDDKEIQKLLSETSEDRLVCQDLEGPELFWGSRVRLEKTEEFYIILITGADAEKDEIPVLFGMLQECFEEINLKRLHGNIPPGDGIGQHADPQ